MFTGMPEGGAIPDAGRGGRDEATASGERAAAALGGTRFADVRWSAATGSTNADAPGARLATARPRASWSWPTTSRPGAAAGTGRGWRRPAGRCSCRSCCARRPRVAGAASLAAGGGDGRGRRAGRRRDRRRQVAERPGRRHRRRRAEAGRPAGRGRLARRQHDLGRLPDARRPRPGGRRGRRRAQRVVAGDGRRPGRRRRCDRAGPRTRWPAWPRRSTGSGPRSTGSTCSWPSCAGWRTGTRRWSRTAPTACSPPGASRSATLGRRVRVDLGADDVEGTAVDVTGDGHLVVETAEGDRRTLAVGDVVHLRPG